jgi:hypothetical protein
LGLQHIPRHDASGMPIHRKTRGNWLAIAIFALAYLGPAAVAAETPPSPPDFVPCSPASVPELPPRWRAVGLMLPFLQGQIDVAELVYDGSLPAMRATAYGLKAGAVDLLITDKETYVLGGPHDSPTQCTSLGPRLRVPAAQWLPADAVCTGEASLNDHPVQWWHTSGFDPARYWITKDTRLPWRSLFLRRSLHPAIVGDYAMSYFPVFEPVPETNLMALRSFCAANSIEYSGKVPDVPSARDLMSLPNAAAEAERLDRIKKLIPGLSHQACSRMAPVRWPDRYVTTAMVTPIQFDDDPYSALILYDWSETGTQLILPFQGRPLTLQGIISLKKNVGYRMRLPPKGNGTCAAVLPGLIKPDWMTVASCQCQGVIEHNATLSPSADSQILSCPIKAQGSRIMWNWYTTDGRPIMFTEAMPEGGGVMLADYHDWLPGQTARPSDLELPNACSVPANNLGSSGAGSTFSNVSCSDCHTTAW